MYLFIFPFKMLTVFRISIIDVPQDPEYASVKFPIICLLALL